VGEPYKVAGRRFEPREQPNYDKKGLASWYGPQFHRRMTSNGEWFDMNRLTAAHPTLPLPSYVKVTNLDNGRELVVRVNDRGPFVGDRIIDLSRQSADALGLRKRGTAPVRVQYIGPAPLNDSGIHLQAMNRELERGTSLKRMIAAANRNRGNVQVAAAPKSKAKAAKAVTVAYLAPAAPPPASSGIDETYYVQVGSFADPDNAEKARAALASAWPVQVIEVDGAAGALYRVRLGPIADRRDADTALADAVSLGHPDAHVVVAHAMQAAL
jgi:rare lipoprotein A